jgi:hypothetical protein
MKGSNDKKFEEEIERINKKVIHYLFTIFSSMITSLVVTLAYLYLQAKK